MKIWIVCEMGGEGPMHAFSTKAKAKAFGDDGLIYGSLHSPEGKPYDVPGAAVGSPVFVTCLTDRGCCYCVGGVFATADAARAKAGDLPPDIASVAEGEMEVVELSVE
jgi:hypothetical protein